MMNKVTFKFSDYPLIYLVYTTIYHILQQITNINQYIRRIESAVMNIWYSYQLSVGNEENYTMNVLSDNNRNRLCY